MDVQNDFVDPKGNLYVTDAESVIPEINAKVAQASAAGCLIVYTQDWHPETTPHFAKDGGIWPVHCVADSWGAEFYPHLNVLTDAQFIKKGVGGEDGYSGFTVRDPHTDEESATRLSGILRGHGVSKVEIIGIATDYCVKETAIDARKLGFEATVFLDCVKGVELKPGDVQTAIDEMASTGVEVIEG